MCSLNHWTIREVQRLLLSCILSGNHAGETSFEERHFQANIQTGPDSGASEIENFAYSQLNPSSIQKEVPHTSTCPAMPEKPLAGEHLGSFQRGREREGRRRVRINIAKNSAWLSHTHNKTAKGGQRRLEEAAQDFCQREG